jgi:hypothetical protein
MSGEREWDVQFRNPGNFDDEVRVDATDAVAAEANCREYLTSLFPEITIDGWEICSVKEAEIVIDTDDLPRPSYEDAEKAIGEVIVVAWRPRPSGRGGNALARTPSDLNLRWNINKICA